MEKWKDVKGYEGFYQVSDKGRVRGLDRLINNKGCGKSLKKGKILKQSYNNYGYLFVNLCKNGKQKTHKVHRLVAEAFISNPNNYKIVNHKDECKAHNVSENLEWCTFNYNINYGTARERAAVSNSKQVYQYTLDGKLIKIWKSTRETETMGYRHTNVAACCRGEKHYKTYKGYRWSYKPL